MDVNDSLAAKIFNLISDPRAAHMSYKMIRRPGVKWSGRSVTWTVVEAFKSAGP